VLILSSLLQISGPAAHNARGFVSGQMFNRKGEVKDFIIYVHKIVKYHNFSFLSS
jgi:hypothetical protein